MDLIRLYPAAWRARYGDEMAALLEDRPASRRDRLDLLRGALDAWLHPPIPSRVPAAAALFGGGLWTILATIVALQPVPADWPGYLLEIVPVAMVSVLCLFVAVIGCALRLGDGAGRAATVAVAVTCVGYVAWLVTLAGTAAGVLDGPTLAAAQAIAMVGTAWVGILLVRNRDEPTGGLVAIAALVMLIPSTAGWLAFGSIWTVVGLVGLVQRSTRIGPAGFA